MGVKLLLVVCLYTISICQNVINIAFCLDVISGSLSLVSHLMSSTFSCYSYTISHIYYQNFVNRLYITPSNFAVCRLIAKNVFWKYTVTPLQGGYIWAFLHQVLSHLWCSYLREEGAGSYLGVMLLLLFTTLCRDLQLARHIS